MVIGALHKTYVSLLSGNLLYLTCSYNSLLAHDNWQDCRILAHFRYNGWFPCYLQTAYLLSILVIDLVVVFLTHYTSLLICILTWMAFHIFYFERTRPPPPPQKKPHCPHYNEHLCFIYVHWKVRRLLLIKKEIPHIDSSVLYILTYR